MPIPRQQQAPLVERSSPSLAESGSRGPRVDSVADGSADPLPDLSRIHRVGLTDLASIRALLDRVRDRSVMLEGGLGRQLDREQAWIESIADTSFAVRVRNFDLDQRQRVALTFSLDGETYLIHSALLEIADAGARIRLSIPDIVYRVERRERPRMRPGESGRVPSRATLRWRQIEIPDARVVDYSHDGVRLAVPSGTAPAAADSVEVHFLDGIDANEVRTGRVRRRSNERGDGWEQIGLSITTAPPGPLLPIERREVVLERRPATLLRDRWQMLRGSAWIAVRRSLERAGVDSSPRIDLDVVRFANARGEEIVGLCDSFRPGPGAPVVIMPPAWAKTKETLLPLARAIVETFRRADQPVSVLRLDGIRRRGESFNDPECRAAGRECHRMTFSQGVSDIRAAIDFVESSPRFRATRIVLVTFSGAAIEARKVLASETSDRVCGWVSVVGAADLKSGLLTVSGGQDFIGGCERGVRFGIQRVLGIETDADLVCRDALENDLAHLEDARRQMARVRVPITWIQGRHDAWIDPERVREMLSCGETSLRRIVEVPTGHQLRTSREALDSFQLIASEIGRFVTGRALEPVVPDLPLLELRRRAERERLPRAPVDLRQFWSEYMLGRDGRPGMELLMATSPYRELLADQVDALSLRPGDRVADLGSGTGSLPRFLFGERGQQTNVVIDELELLRGAISAASRQIDTRTGPPHVRFVQCDLSLGSARFVPARDGTYDALLASLLLNYVDNPGRLLAEARRILRPGGRLVISVLRKDTDISRIYLEAANEIRAGKTRGVIDGLSTQEIEDSVRSFLNEAARLLDLEEQGFFHFWEPDELASQVRSVGFGEVRTRLSFGHPPQAVVVSAVAR